MTQDARPEDDAADPKPDWRKATTFNQGEPYGSDAADPTAPRGPSRSPAPTRGDDGRLKRLLIAGASMIATSFLLRLLGVGGLWAFLAGLAVFAAILFAPGRNAGAAAPPVRRTVAPLPGVNTAFVQEDLDKAEGELAALDALAGKFERPAIADAIGRFTTASRAVLDEIARDPNDAERTRKFLVVILPSARRSAEKFLETGVRDAELDGRFESLMADLETAATRQLDTLRADEKLDLEVEMEVLADRLKSGA
jgi:hypothetical protein